jgi:PAS domain S-box-containing protein
MTNTPLRHKVLVIDDDLLSMEMLIGILAEEYDVLHASGGKAALALLTETQPDLILLDVVMPGMDGYQVYQQIKEIPDLADIPVLFLTCMAEQECESRGLEMGAVDYITKPYNPHIVRLRVRNHLLLKFQRDQINVKYKTQQTQDKERKRLEQELRQLSLEQRTILDTSIVGIAMIRDRSLIWSNRAMAEIFGYELAEITDVPTRQFYRSDIDYEQLGTAAYPRFCQGLEYQAEVQMQRKDGCPVWVRMFGRAINPDNPAEGSVWVFENIESHKKLEEAHQKDEIQLRRSEIKFSTIFRTSPDVIAISEKSTGRFLEVNEAYERIIGYSREEAIGSTARELGTWGSQELRQQLIEKLGNQKRLLNYQTSFRRKCGDIFPVLLSLEQADIDGVECIIISARDITEQEQIKNELRYAKESADAANRSKSEFLANMSHEIRTPLNGVVGMTQLLRFTELTSEQQEYLNSIELSADNLLSLINDILDLSKIESGKVELEYAVFSLRKAVDDVIITQQSRIFQKQLNLQKELSIRLPEVVRGDQLRVKQILLNLLGNAIKFTEQGSITIAADLLECSGNRALVRLTISDTGIGMTPETMQKIFKPFEQADTSTTRRFGGTGLGLTICRKLAEMMGGAIRVESIPGSGSSFHLDIPFEMRTNAAMPQGQAKASGTMNTPAQPLRVLIAEDNLINQRTLELILKKIGHQAICTNNGKEALERWRKGDVDVILMDIQMPVMGGVEAVTVIREEEPESNRNTPIIALTADALKGTEQHLLQSGFDGYLTKPVRIKVLKEELERVVIRSSQTP